MGEVPVLAQHVQVKRVDVCDAPKVDGPDRLCPLRALVLDVEPVEDAPPCRGGEGRAALAEAEGGDVREGLQEAHNVFNFCDGCGDSESRRLGAKAPHKGGKVSTDLYRRE